MVRFHGIRQCVIPARRLFAAAMLLLLVLSTFVEADLQPTDGDRATVAAVPAYRQANKIAVLRVEGVIDMVTLRSLERRVEQARNDGATAVVLDINTPGGELTATLDICHLIKTDAPANTVAWINPQAYSAGTIIALACREIVVQENARFGDAAPIQASPFGIVPLPADERAKIESPILEEVIDSAQRNHYDQNLVQAFISAGVELWMLEHRETGERVFANRQEYQAVFGESPPDQLTPLAHDVERPDRGRIVPRIDQVENHGVEESPDESVVVLDQRGLPEPRTALTTDDGGKYRLLRQVTSRDRILTLRPEEAMYYGLATAKIRNDEELLAYFGGQELVRYNENWSEKLARFLMSWPVRAVLIIIFLVCLFVELAAPGTGVFGTAALVALLLIFGAPAMMGMAQWLGLLFIVLGLGLIALELFVIPGVGVAGVAGLLSLMIGLVASFVTGDLGTVDGQNQLWAGLATTITAMFAAGVAIWLVSRQVRSIPVLEQLILRTELADRRAGASATAVGTEAAVDAVGRPVIQEGDLGIAHTDLRPAGRANFDGRIVDVQSPGGFIDRGRPIRVISVGRYVIDVEEADT